MQGPVGRRWWTRTSAALSRDGEGLAQQAQHALLALVGLREHRGRRLAQDLRLGERGRFRREVGVLDARARVGQVGDVEVRLLTADSRRLWPAPSVGAPGRIAVDARRRASVIASAMSAPSPPMLIAAVAKSIQCDRQRRPCRCRSCRPGSCRPESVVASSRTASTPLNLVFVRCWRSGAVSAVTSACRLVRSASS